MSTPKDPQRSEMSEDAAEDLELQDEAAQGIGGGDRVVAGKTVTWQTGSGGDFSQTGNIKR